MKKVIFLSFTVFFILSCSQKALKNAEDSLLPPTEKQTLLDANLLLEKADETQASRKNLLRIQAAYILIKNKSYEQAEEALSKVKTDNLNNELSAFFYSQQAEIFLQQQNPKQAVDLLNSKVKPDLLSHEGKIIYRETKSKAFFQNTQYIESINELIFISPLLENQHKKSNNEIIWKTLSLLSLESIDNSLRINESADTTNDLTLWLELAKINKAYQHDIELQSQKLDEWLEGNKTHEANDALPETLKQIKFAIKNRPKKIAVFLPESGPFARSSDAIKRGFLNNYYRALESNSFTPEIVFYNTSDENLEKIFISSNTNTNNPHQATDINKNNNSEKGFLISYQNAIDNGADLIVGPINKTYIDLLQNENRYDTPTLTLNYSNVPNLDKKNNIFQFGLAPEDEIDFIAEQAWLKGYKNVAILAPNSDWGNRLNQSFKSTWKNKGGEVVSISRYENTRELTKVIEGMLNIDQSEKRFKKLYWYSDGKVLFYSRRREDIDFIYLVSSPEMGRQIIPTFAFHHASNIPVYSNSNIYSGEYNSSDRDLNGLMFSDLPSIINGDPSQNPWRNQDTRYNRLIAMGMDTYDLSVRLNILKSSQQNKMYGQTGNLDISDTLRINRKPILARFYGGQAKAIPILFESNQTPITK